MGEDASFVASGEDGVRVPVAQRRRFDYSDGDAAEQAILDAVSSAHDVSSGSDELARLITDWTTLYHLSPARADLLEPFSWDGLDVLEVGPGCGALTRFLGEAGARVTAVEGSFRRATITARRCRGLAGVEVFCDDFASFPVTRRYDVVLAIGVLEYAPRFFSGSDPVAQFLQRAREFLKPDGTLLVAIENRLGLKYFSGSREDHIGEPFYGIEDRYTPADGVVTLGRLELLAELEAGGLAPREVIYPFPDYKHAKVLVREQGLRSSVLDVGELICHAGHSRADVRAPLLFADEAVWGVVQANGLVADLSNSFVVVAGSEAGAQALLADDWLAKAYASGRCKAYRTVTAFRGGADGIVVEKRLRHSGADLPPDALADLQVLEQSDYVVGGTLAGHCVRVASGSEATVADVVDALRPWLELLRDEIENGGGRLPGRFIDCVPGNLLCSARRPDGLTYFDAEWEYRQPIAPERVLLRGMLLLAARLERLVVAPDLRAVPLRQLIGRVAEAYGTTVANEGLEALVEEEADWAAQVMPVARASYIDSVQARLDAPLGAPCRLGAFADTPAIVTRVLAERAEDVEQLAAATAEKDLHITKLDTEVRRIIAAKDAELAARDAELTAAIAEKDLHITKLDTEVRRIIAARDAELAARDAESAAKDEQLAALQGAAHALQAVEASLSWRITRPLRWMSRKVRRA